MKIPGPPLEALLDRLISIPDVFISGSGQTGGTASGPSVPSLVNDMLLDNGGTPLTDDEIFRYFSGIRETRAGSKKLRNNNYPGIVSILCYIYEDRFFTGNKSCGDLIKKFILSHELSELAGAVDSPDEFVNDPDRREEICRRALDALNYHPAGETENNAHDRLLTLDSVERKKILIKTTEAQMRAKQIHEAMMRREAEEAASKMSRE